MIGFTLQQIFQQGDSVLDPAILQVPADVEHLSAWIPQCNPTDLELPLAVGEPSVVALIGLIAESLNGINESLRVDVPAILRQLHEVHIVLREGCGHGG